MQKQQPLAGFLFSLMAVIMWGTLPIALQPVLKEMNAQTIVWFRFIVAMFGVGLMLFFAKKLPKITALSRKDLGLLLLGIAGLSGNFFLFNVALRYIPATASQVLSPLSSFAMILLGAFLFKEQIRLNQKLGFIIVVIGLLLFFHNRFADFSQMNGYAFGILCGMTASLIWIGYGLSQRLLLDRFNSMQILFMIYIGCSIVFTPLADFSQTASLSTFAVICLVYCCLNTIIAYGTYAEALNRWDVSKVSIMMPLIPIFTMVFSEMAYFWKPESFTPPDLSFLTVLGDCLVVFGALFSAIGHKLLHRRRVKK